MLNESDRFDKLSNQLKQEKIEEHRNYEKQKKAKERQNEKEKINEEEYDLNNLIYNFDNNNDFPKKEEKKDEEIKVFNRRKADKNDSNLFNDENKINKEQNNNKSKQNRRGNTRHFLEETENYGGFNFGQSPKKKSK